MQAVHDFLSALQARIVAALEAEDGGRFRTDAWQRAEGGGGTTRILEDGAVFERAGVNMSHVQGSSLPPSATASRPQLAGLGFLPPQHPQSNSTPRARLIAIAAVYSASIATVSAAVARSDRPTAMNAPRMISAASTAREAAGTSFGGRR